MELISEHSETVVKEKKISYFMVVSWQVSFKSRTKDTKWGQSGPNPDVFLTAAADPGIPPPPNSL